eukprot:10048742-Heterocapsa_arctica.AAC.1
MWEDKLAGDFLFGWMDAGEAGSKTVVKFVEDAIPYLQDLQQNVFKDMKQHARMDGLLVVLRCMAALLIPVPGALGSSSKDVER